MKFTYFRLFFLLPLFALGYTNSLAQCNPNDSVPFSTDSTHLTVWNGNKYVPFFVKGVNLGASIPGKFPGELDVSKQQYINWIIQMREAGFNVIRLYTLHYPHFYQVLDSINDANPQKPVFIFQGIWLDEEPVGYTHDLYELTTIFDEEIQNNINCIHGNNNIAQRPGKAWGSYTVDVSKWTMGYIIGREVYPNEVLNANNNHTGNTAFYGARVAITSTTPAEAWVAGRLNRLVTYEYQYYQTMRPVSFSSWPTLDPLNHPQEPARDEDTASLSMANLDMSNSPAGYFASYHAYPYYPDFMSTDSKYTPFKDETGQNSYLGYLTYLKQVYKKFPLIIAEYGVPSSWVSAHFAQSGMHHGGFDERAQGENNMRILRNIETSGCGGGMVFAWIDEWFKRTWIADPLDYVTDSRILWHNLSSPEQNFGLIGFQRPFNLQSWQTFSPGSPVREIKAFADYDFFHMQLDLLNPLALQDTVWIALDTYAPSLGESALPDGHMVSNRAEFALRLTNYSAQLFVTEAYDLFGIWHNTSTPEQQYHSVVSNGGKWNILRMRNNSFYSDVQYIGNLQLHKGGLLPSSKDAVTIYDDHIEVKLPWNYLHFVAPDKKRVFHDYRNQPGDKDTTSDGIAVTILHNGYTLSPSTRFSWNDWNTALDVVEHHKESYYIMKDQLPLFNSAAVTRCDQYIITGTTQPDAITVANGVLKNDFDMDGNTLEAVLIKNPANGKVDLNRDGSFTYTPNAGYTGADVFEYSVYDGRSLSEPTKVFVQVSFAASIQKPEQENDNLFVIYPNPGNGRFTIKSEQLIHDVTVFNVRGEKLGTMPLNSKSEHINISHLDAGIYFIKATIGKQALVKRVMLVKN